jgi:hypothetical protein
MPQILVMMRMKPWRAGRTLLNEGRGTLNEDRKAAPFENRARRTNARVC